MKYFYLLAFISLSVFAQRPSSEPKQIVQVFDVENIQHKDKKAIVTFKGLERKYVLPEDNKYVPCLWNSMKAQQRVILQMDEGREAIYDCRLYIGGALNMENSQGKNLKQAQEEKKSLQKKDTPESQVNP